MSSTANKKISTKIKIICGTMILIFVSIILRRLLGEAWFWIFWEFFGAVLVAWGCAGEWRLIAHWPKTVRKAEHDVLELRYVTAVAAGVIMELIALTHSIPEAVRMETELAEVVRSNIVLATELETAKSNQTRIDPLNQPVSEITASARFLWRSTNDWAPIGEPETYRIELIETNITLNLEGFGTLVENEGRQYTESDSSGSYRGAYLTFRPDRILSFPSGIVLADMSPVTPRKVLNAIKIVAFNFASVPNDVEVFRGSLELRVNEFTKHFQISAQKPATNGIFYATNLANPF